MEELIVKQSEFPYRQRRGCYHSMNLQTPDGGFVLAIGWTGQWAAAFVRKGDDLGKVLSVGGG